jgi:hypothetical protein
VPLRRFLTSPTVADLGLKVTPVDGMSVGRKPRFNHEKTMN